MKKTDIKYSDKYKKTRSDVNKFEYSKIESKVDNYNNDYDLFDRREEQVCKYCYYIILPFVVGLTTFVERNCLSCGKEMHFPSSVSDVLCIDCAKKHDACKHCGGEMD